MIQYSIFTNIGDRSVNEDAVLATEKEGSYCFVLADGLGGHGKGEIASQLVVDSICKLYNGGYYEDFLDDAFSIAQRELAQEKMNRKEKNGMLTTAVVLTIHEKQAHWAHLGDSRLYYFKNNKMISRTEDHSVPQMMVLAKELKEKKIRNHPDRNKLTKALGSMKRVLVCTKGLPVDLSKNQAFLLCSDGFWELILEREMMRTLKKSVSVESWMDAMTDIVLKRGRKQKKEMDNYSAIAVWCEGA